MTSKLEFSTYDPAWASRFLDLAQKELSDLPGDARIEHVGSTAVPDLPSKDCIDVLVTAGDEQALLEVLALFRSRGLEYRPDSFADDPQRFFLRKVEDGRRLAHLHLMTHGHPAVAEMMAVRDLLRRDESWRTEYARLKQNLAERFPDDRGSYIDGKDAFMKQLTRAAITE